MKKAGWSLRPVQAASESAHAHASAGTRHLLRVAKPQLAPSPSSKRKCPRACFSRDPSSAARCQATACAQSKQQAKVPTRMLQQGPVICCALASHSLHPVQAASESESSHAHASAGTRYLPSQSSMQNILRLYNLFYINIVKYKFIVKIKND